MPRARPVPARSHLAGDDLGDGLRAVGFGTADELIDRDEPEAVDTGLVDERGRRIYRRRPTVKFGFVP